MWLLARRLVNPSPLKPRQARDATTVNCSQQILSIAAETLNVLFVNRLVTALKPVATTGEFILSIL